MLATSKSNPEGGDACANNVVVTLLGCPHASIAEFRLYSIPIVRDLKC